MPTIIVRESFDQALRVFKKKVIEDQILKDLSRHQYFLTRIERRKLEDRYALSKKKRKEKRMEENK